MLTLVSASPHDTARVERLVRSAYSMYIERIGRPPAPMEADYSAAIANGNVVLALLGDGPSQRLAGVLVTVPKADHLLIENVAVPPEFQGRGIGARLLEHAEELARSSGYGELRLYTNAKMTENLDYYPRRGYRETGRRSEDGFDRVYFARVLS